MNQSIPTVDISTDKAMRTAVEAAKEAGNKLLSYYYHTAYHSKFKEDTSLQTTADIEAESIIIDKIQRNFPSHAIKGEENGEISSSSSYYTWLIDPLDGTENFYLSIPYFSTSITLCAGDEPLIAVVYNPITQELYTAEKGKGAFLNCRPIHVSNETRLKGCRAFFIPDFLTKRRSNTAHFRDSLYMHCRRVLDTWSPALDWCLVASGKVDLLVTIAGTAIQPDAGILILEESGGTITDFQGNRFSSENNGRLVGCNAALHHQLLQLIKDTYTEDDNSRILL